jgi:ribokinase
MTHVVCIGDLMVDVIAQLPGPLAPRSDTPAPIDIIGGGAAANVAAWLVTEGVSATFVGRVGDDALGLRAVEELSAAGVVPMVIIDPDRATGTCIVLVSPAGERTMVPSAGANSGPNEVGILPAEADWLYLSGYALLDPGPRQFALDALDIARDRGWSIAVDAASAAPLEAVGRETFLDWIGPDLLLFANTDEALVLTGSDDAATAAHTLARRTGHAIVKRGSSGAVWSNAADVRSVPASDVRILDSTGAGDAFAAGFLAGTGDVDERLANAVRLAARAITRVGARPHRSSI